MLDNVKALKKLSGWLYVVVTLLIIGSVIAGLYNSNYFPIKQVKIEGSLAHTDSDSLQKIAAHYVRGNIFKADLNGAQHAFEQLPWIEAAVVRRRLPNTVEISLTEHEPLARWKDGSLVDSKGQLFKARYDEKLPAFEGESGTEKVMAEHYQKFGQQLKPLNLTIDKLVYSPRSAWSVVLDNKITVYLGREYENERLNRFAEVWRSILKPQQPALDYVDMRYKDGFAIRQRPIAERQETISAEKTAKQQP